MTSLAALCISMVVAQAAPAAESRRAGVWIVIDKGVAARAGKIATREIDTLAAASPGWAFTPPTAAQKRKLIQLGRKCFPAANLDCALRAAALIDVPYLVTAHLARSRPAPAFALELVEVKSRTVLGRADGVVRPRTMAEDVGAVWKALLAGLAPTGVAAPVTRREPPPAPPEPPSLAGAAPLSPAAAAPPGEPMMASAGPGPAATLSPAMSEEWTLETPDPLVLHAEAMALRLDGKLDPARQALRRALELSPQNELIAFDLAKLALSGANDAFERDVATFLAQTPSTPDARLLRAHISMRRGNRDEAAEHLRAALAGQRDHVEALRLQHVLAPAAPRAATPAWSFRVGTGAQGDTNVAVLPDDVPGPEPGLRGVFDGSITARPLRGPLEVDTVLRVNLASQINDRDDPRVQALADIGSAALSARVRGKGAAAALSAEIYGSQVMLDRFREVFMRDGGARLEVRVPLAVEIGAYAAGAWRDFAFGNLDGPTGDRDGPRVEGGVLVATKKGRLRGRASAGAQAELAQGRDQKEWGPQGDLSLAVAVADLSVDLALSYHMRDYAGADIERREHRLTPSLRLAYAFSDNLGAYGSYSLMKSLSETYPFTRHLGAAGVYAAW